MGDTATPAAKMMKLILETIEGMKETPFITGCPGANRAVSTLTMAHNMISDLEAELRTLREDKATLERRRLNCHELMLDCWNQFAQLPDGYSTQDLSTLEDLEYALFDLSLIDDDGKPRWDELNAAIAAAKEPDADPS